MISPNSADQDALSPIAAQGLSRRRMIGGLGLSGLGLLASTGQVSAFSSPKVFVPTTRSSNAASPQIQRIDLTALPVEWVKGQGALLTEYTRYIWNLKLKNISTAAVIEPHAKRRGAVWNDLPPKAWWSRMAYTLRVVDRIATELKVNEVEIISAYRSPRYNANCEGAKTGSWHQANLAVDVKFPVRASVVTSTSRNLRDRGLFKGGVGGYGGFTHIDTRGENMNW